MSIHLHKSKTELQRREWNHQVTSISFLLSGSCLYPILFKKKKCFLPSKANPSTCSLNLCLSCFLNNLFGSGTPFCYIWMFSLSFFRRCFPFLSFFLLKKCNSFFGQEYLISFIFLKNSLPGFYTPHLTTVPPLSHVQKLLERVAVQSVQSHFPSLFSWTNFLASALIAATATAPTKVTSDYPITRHSRG